MSRDKPWEWRGIAFFFCALTFVGAYLYHRGANDIRAAAREGGLALTPLAEVGEGGGVAFEGRIEGGEFRTQAPATGAECLASKTRFYVMSGRRENLKRSLIVEDTSAPEKMVVRADEGRVVIPREQWSHIFYDHDRKLLRRPAFVGERVPPKDRIPKFGHYNVREQCVKAGSFVRVTGEAATVDRASGDGASLPVVELRTSKAWPLRIRKGGREPLSERTQLDITIEELKALGALALGLVVFVVYLVWEIRRYRRRNA
jgi:hypothetical protein